MQTDNRREDAARIVTLRDRERVGAFWSFAYFFCLLSCYYVLRPLRDELGIQGGVQSLPWLFTGTLAVMLCAVPIYGWVTARLPRRHMLPAVYGFFIVCLLAFYVALRSRYQIAWTARAFFIWVSVFNLFAVSVFWSFMVELFSEVQGRRLFGLIAAGGSGGALVGPTLTVTLAPLLGPSNLLLVCAALLVTATVCIVRLLAWARTESRDEQPACPRDEAIGGSIWAGITDLTRSRYLMGISLHMVLYTTLATFLYLQQARIVSVSIPVSESRTALFAMMDLVVNGISLALQLFLTETLIRRLGIARVLAITPVLAIVGFAFLALSPSLAVVVVFQVIRRAADYGIVRPARELLFTVASLDQRYKAKNFIDTVVFRAGDALGGWLFGALRAVGLGFAGICWLAVPLAALWLAISVMLGRKEAQMRLELDSHRSHEDTKPLRARKRAVDA